MLALGLGFTEACVPLLLEYLDKVCTDGDGRGGGGVALRGLRLKYSFSRRTLRIIVSTAPWWFSGRYLSFGGTLHGSNCGKKQTCRRALAVEYYVGTLLHLSGGMGPMSALAVTPDVIV